MMQGGEAYNLPLTTEKAGIFAEAPANPLVGAEDTPWGGQGGGDSPQSFGSGIPTGDYAGTPNSSSGIARNNVTTMSEDEGNIIVNQSYNTTILVSGSDAQEVIDSLGLGDVQNLTQGVIRVNI